MLTIGLFYNLDVGSWILFKTLILSMYVCLMKHFTCFDQNVYKKIKFELEMSGCMLEE